MEFFFGDEEVQDVASNHLEAIAGLEDREAARVMKSYRRVRQDLRDRLDALDLSGRNGTFTAQKMRGALMQVDLALAEMNRNLNDDMQTASSSAAEMGVGHLIKEIEKWNKIFTGAVIPINVNAVAVATKATNLLFNQRESSLQSYSSFIRGQIGRALADATIAQETAGEIVAGIPDLGTKIGQFFLGEEWKLHRIVRTELHNVYSQGKIRGMLDLWDNGSGEIPDLKKTLYHRIDSRTGKDSIRLAQNNPIVPINEPFVESSTGKELVYMAPPNRPNDRSILIPYREEWKK